MEVEKMKQRTEIMMKNKIWTFLEVLGESPNDQNLQLLRNIAKVADEIAEEMEDSWCNCNLCKKHRVEVME